VSLPPGIAVSFVLVDASQHSVHRQVIATSEQALLR